MQLDQTLLEDIQFLRFKRRIINRPILKIFYFHFKSVFFCFLFFFFLCSLWNLFLLISNRFYLVMTFAGQKSFSVILVQEETLLRVYPIIYQFIKSIIRWAIQALQLEHLVCNCEYSFGLTVLSYNDLQAIFSSPSRKDHLVYYYHFSSVVVLCSHLSQK